MFRTVLIGFLYSAPLILGATHVWHVQEAIAFALDHNRNLAGLALGVLGREQDVVLAETDFLWELSPEGRLGYEAEGSDWSTGVTLSKQQRWGTTFSAGVVLAEGASTNAVFDQARLRFEVSQPLFGSFGPLVQEFDVRNAKRSVRDALRRYEIAKADLALDVAQSYDRLLRLDSELTTEKRTLARLLKQKRIMKAQATGRKQGSRRGIDLLRSALQIGESRTRMTNLVERIASEQIVFRDLIGFPEGVSLPDLAPLPVWEEPLPNQHVAIAVAFSNRLDYAVQLEAVSGSADSKAVAQRQRWPDVSLRSFYDLSDEASTLDLKNDDWFVGLSFSTGLSRARERARYVRSGYLLEEAELTLEDTAFRISREVQLALQDVRRARAALSLAIENTQFSENRLRLATVLYESGRGDAFTLSDAEDALLQARTQEWAARSSVTLSAFRFRYVLGTLVEHPTFLKPVMVDQQ